MLDTSKLKFQKFIDNRTKVVPGFTVGQSGPLKIATDTETGQKYLVKYKYAHNAANEYVAFWLAEQLGIPAPRAYLLSPQGEFKHAVAIEYIEGFKKVDKDIVGKHPEDFCGQLVLSILIDPDDSTQMSYANGHIYSYDYSEGFEIIDYTLIDACLRGENAFVSLGRDRLDSFKRHLSYQDFDNPDIAASVGLEPKALQQGMIRIAKRVQDITEAEICKMSDEIDKVYPCTYGVYYEKCIQAMQQHMSRV